MSRGSLLASGCQLRSANLAPQRRCDKCNRKTPLAVAQGGAYRLGMYCICRDAAARGRPRRPAHERPRHRADKQRASRHGHAQTQSGADKQAYDRAPRLSKSNSTARLESNEPQTHDTTCNTTSQPTICTTDHRNGSSTTEFIWFGYCVQFVAAGSG